MHLQKVSSIYLKCRWIGPRLQSRWAPHFSSPFPSDCALRLLRCLHTRASLTWKPECWRGLTCTQIFTLTQIWDAAKVTLELGLIPRSLSTGTVPVSANLDSLVSSYFPHSSTCFTGSLRHFPKLFSAYSLSLVVICFNTLFVQQFRLDCTLPFDTRGDIDGFFLLCAWA